MSSSERNALVLSRVRVGGSLSVCSQSLPKCFTGHTVLSATPVPPISNNSSQTLTRNPFPHKPMKTSKLRHTSAAGPFKGTFAPLCFFSLFSPFSPHLFFFSSTRCNCSDFLLFSLAPSSLYVSPRRYFLDFLTVSLLIPPLALFDPTSPARPCPSPLSLLTL